MDQGSQSTGAAGSELYNQLKSYFPGISSLVGQQQGNLAQAGLSADQAVSPGYAQLAQSIFSQFAPQNAKTGVDVAGINQKGQTQNTVDTVAGPGTQLVGQANTLQRMLDPNYYSSSDAVGAANLKLLNSMDPTQLSGSERAEVERGIGQNPANLTPSALSTVSNATRFGSALQNKQQRFGNVVQQVAGTLPSLKSGMSGIGIATGGVTQPNTGFNVNTTPTYNAGSNAFNLFGTTGGLFQSQDANAMKNQQPWYAQLGGITKGVGGAAGALGSVIGKL